MLKNGVELEFGEIKAGSVATYNRIFPSKMSTKSFVRLYTLHLLCNHREMYGKEISGEIESAFGSKWKPSHGTLYPLLKTLETEGYLIGEWEDEDKKTKKSYRITKQGREYYENELRQNENMFIDSYNMVVKILNELYGQNKPFLINRI